MKAIAIIIALIYALVGNWTVVTEKSFPDIEGHWAEKEIRLLAGMGYVSGYDDGDFLPQEHITRAQLASIMNKIKNYTVETTEEVIDLDPDVWYARDVRIALGEGYLDGYDDGTFKPQRIVTREEAVTTLNRVFKPKGVGGATGLPFEDTETIQEWAVPSVAVFYSLGYVNGYEDGTFDPKRGVTRAEIIKMIYSIMQK